MEYIFCYFWLRFLPSWCTRLFKHSNGVIWMLWALYRRCWDVLYQLGTGMDSARVLKWKKFLGSTLDRNPIGRGFDRFLDKIIWIMKQTNHFLEKKNILLRWRWFRKEIAFTFAFNSIGTRVIMPTWTQLLLSFC